VDLAPFPALSRWYATLGERPAVRRGMDVPTVDITAEQRLRSGAAIVTR
jgi:glutathione S-transferase